MLEQRSIRLTVMNHLRKIVILFLILLPIFSLSLNAISWIAFGIDLPYVDDWRDYLSGTLGSYNIKHLFEPVNVTLYPIGKIIDSLIYNNFNGNSIVYQFLSMISVLGLLLFFQWRLLFLTLKDTFLTAVAFSITLLMLQPNTYWGMQDNAYIQGVPLICILASLTIALSETWKATRDISLLLILGFISGFSYISGAFAILTMSIIFLMLSRYIKPGEEIQIKKSGWALFIPGIVTTIAQSWVMICYQRIYMHQTPITWPTDSDFWWYMIGKIGRSLMLPANYPTFSLIMTCIFVFTVLAIVFIFLTFFKKGNISFDNAKPGIIYISLVSLLFTYLMLISAGRTNLSRPSEIIKITEIFTWGFMRFHYFWITLLWPWLVAMVFVLNKKRSFVKSLFSAIILLFAIPMMIQAGAIKHSKYYQTRAVKRIEGIKCIIDQMRNGKEIYCPSIGKNHNLEKAITFAKETNASFLKSLPFIYEMHKLQQSQK